MLTATGAAFATPVLGRRLTVPPQGQLRGRLRAALFIRSEKCREGVYERKPKEPDM